MCSEQIQKAKTKAKAKSIGKVIIKAKAKAKTKLCTCSLPNVHIRALYCFITRVLIDNNCNKRYCVRIKQYNRGYCVSFILSLSLHSIRLY